MRPCLADDYPPLLRRGTTATSAILQAMRLQRPIPAPASRSSCGAQLRYGADPNINTLLPMAAGHGDAWGVMLLLAAGGAPNRALPLGGSPLCKAADSGHAMIVMLLLAAGADPNSKDNDRETPLHWAARRGSTEVLSLLLAAGADVESQKL